MASVSHSLPRLVFEKGHHLIPVTGGFLRQECQKLFSYRTTTNR